MRNIRDLKIVIGATMDDGQAKFVDVDKPLFFSEESGIEVAWIWATNGVPELPYEIGSVPTSRKFPTPGGSRVGLVFLPPHSVGRVPDSMASDPLCQVGEHEDPAMHRTDSVDYEFVLSGEVDIEIPGGQVRKLGPGSCFVMGGVAHAWRNPYDDPCIYAVVVVGAGTGDALTKGIS
jgi:mannose-6-phosphate isomerase-like protein (cupin superfamily)